MIRAAGPQGRGRQATRDCAAIPELLALLGSGDGRVRARAVGALHNLSADPQSVRMMRRSNGVAPLTALLKCALLVLGLGAVLQWWCSGAVKT